MEGNKRALKEDSEECYNRVVFAAKNGKMKKKNFFVRHPFLELGGECFKPISKLIKEFVPFYKMH